MAHYQLSIDQATNHILIIQYSLQVQSNETLLYLPLWRPGRYELGNFAKNIISFTCYNEKNDLLTFEKIEKSKWKVNTSDCYTLIVKYTYYANELNAGSTWLDEQQLYVNPVNCFIYEPSELNKPQQLTLLVPANYKVATTLSLQDNFNYTSESLHQLFDNPFIASANLKEQAFIVNDVNFKLFFQGICNPDWEKLKNDFQKFIEESIQLFGSFTCDEYHFLFQITPYSHYHGVEHVTNTVIALGPGYAIMQKPFYNELLGVSCHELFHSWNVKTIRAAEMHPYDYQTENYSNLGFICEGITTYYGDYLLYRSGVFSFAEWQDTFNVQLTKHLNNPARFNMSVAQSSLDTWLDGYSLGVPNRKVSIYTEGCLLAFMLDIIIRKNTSNTKCLDDVMKILNNDFAKNNKGYTIDDYKNITTKIAQVDLAFYFQNYVYGKSDYQPLLLECLQYIGLTINSKVNDLPFETYLGFKLVEQNGKQIVSHVYKDSVAEQAGLVLNDIILSVNNIAASADLSKWFTYFEYKKLNLLVSKQHKIVSVNLSANSQMYYKIYELEKLQDLSIDAKNNFTNWSKQST